MSLLDHVFLRYGNVQYRITQLLKSESSLDIRGSYEEYALIMNHAYVGRYFITTKDIPDEWQDITASGVLAMFQRCGKLTNTPIDKLNLLIPGWLLSPEGTLNWLKEALTLSGCSPKPAVKLNWSKVRFSLKKPELAI